VNNDSLAAFQCLKSVAAVLFAVRSLLRLTTYDMFFMPQLDHQFFSLFVFSVKGQEIVNKNKPIALTPSWGVFRSCVSSHLRENEAREGADGTYQSIPR
jgi:hypothetical protein